LAKGAFALEKTVNVHTAKTNLSSLLAEVESGEEIVIARAGKPVARLVPVRRKIDASIRRKIAGSLKSKIRIGRNFNDPLPGDMLAAFQGEKS
jgi:prevent-host-death family protein